MLSYIDKFHNAIEIFNRVSSSGVKMTWDELYRDQGLKWEVIISKTKAKERIYSFRFSRKYRALALREELYLRLLTLHTNHDKNSGLI